MDRVKLGRALGYGTRHAAKTVAAVVEAAAAPAPQAMASRPAEAQAARASVAETPTETQAARASVAETPTRARRPLASSARPVARGVRQGMRSIWGPLAVYSGALWLRVTGLFFALIAFSLGGGAWRLRRSYRPGSPGMHHFWIFVGFALVFAYFAASSFVRATLKERRAAALTR